MENKLAERRQVVDVLMKNAIVSKQDDIYRVLVPGAIREENFVSAETEEEAKRKVRDVLHVKEESRLRSQAKLESGQTVEGHVEITPHKSTKGSGIKSSTVGGSSEASRG